MSLEPARRRREQSRADARRTILDATEALLVSGGYENFSIRKLVDRCGYSAPSIYHHFGDKPGLLDALLEERLEKLAADLRAVSLGDDAVENMHATSRAFTHFGLKNPSHYLLLTTPRADDAEPPPSAEEVRAILVQPMAELFDQDRLYSKDLEEAQQVIWSFMHGLISLQISRPNENWSLGLLDAAIEVMVRGCVRPEPNGNTRQNPNAAVARSTQ